MIRDAFTQAEVSGARRTVLAHSDLMKNTRPTPSSRHLAGFHRFPELAPLHAFLTDNAAVRHQIGSLLGDAPRTIGLSDITINRSQAWHKDLLRGRYRHYLGEGDVCALHHGKVFKVIVYLQDSTSLQVIEGSHRIDISLTSDRSAVPSPEIPVTRVDAKKGDAVIIDVCTTHRGSEESAYESAESQKYPRILVSTVFGRVGCPFTERMEAGNAARLVDWMHRC